jgi:hypothetical protein
MQPKENSKRKKFSLYQNIFENNSMHSEQNNSNYIALI